MLSFHWISLFALILANSLSIHSMRLAEGAQDELTPLDLMYKDNTMEEKAKKNLDIKNLKKFIKYVVLDEVRKQNRPKVAKGLWGKRTFYF